VEYRLFFEEPTLRYNATTSANVSERQRTSVNTNEYRYDFSHMFIDVRWCSLRFVGVHSFPWLIGTHQSNVACSGKSISV